MSENNKIDTAAMDGNSCEDITESPGCCCHRTKERSEKEYKDLINRLQVSAIRSALNSFNKVLLENHIKTCVKDDILSGSDDKVEELVDTIQKLMK